MKHSSSLFKLMVAGFAILCSFSGGYAQIRARYTTTLTDWMFSKDQTSWQQVQIPHSCNALDGHSAQYFRGKTYYKKVLKLNSAELNRHSFLLFEGAAQTATVNLNGTQIMEHKGGYTPFVVPLQGLLKKGENLVEVVCDNHEDPQLAPVSSDFNKNNGLHNPVRLLQMNDVFFSPESFGQYRLHVSMPEFSKNVGRTVIESQIRNEGKKAKDFVLQTQIINREGKVQNESVEKIHLAAKGSFDYHSTLLLHNPHLWDGLQDPYLYDVVLTIKDSKGQELDRAETKIGYRFYEMTRNDGFFLNGHPYPLRGVAVHQDWDGHASALQKQNYDEDYKIIQELGCNFLRLAHYPHNDYVFRKCDSLGIIVQTEIPWVNVCGVLAQPEYFTNLHQQMKEMISNLYNHPAICFWGMWNELDSWGNKAGNKLQDVFDPKRVVEETAKLYDYAKTLDPYREIGLTDCSQFMRTGYTDLKGDYYSENRYNGWYQNVGKMYMFRNQIERIHDLMGITNVSEYGAGGNPFCHTTDTLQTYLRNRDDKNHFEEYQNMIHESHVRQIQQMPFLNFTSAWVLFDFAVAARTEGYIDSDDGVNFHENDARKYTNDKGLVTRDRKVKKDVFYLYKSLWNKKETTVHITSSRLHYYPASKPIIVKVYSNAKGLTLYQNGEEVQHLIQSGEDTGVIWTFGPMKFKSNEDRFKVVASDGTTDEISWKKLEEQQKVNGD